MKIGIIGTGSIGGTLARKFRDAGHEVRVANSRGVEGVRAFADEIGAIPADVRGAVGGADLVVLSIPFPALAALPSDLFAGVLHGTPIVDTNNYYPGVRDPHIAELDEGMPESLWVSEQIGRPVIKAFNNLLAFTLENLGLDPAAPGRLAVAVAGDEGEAKKTVMSLVNQIGFDPVDGGSLEESWKQQPFTPCYCCDYDAGTMRRALAAAVEGVAASKLESFVEQYMALGPNPSHEDMVAINRSLNAFE
jgi:predicted dinucleotide-binding enzyme